MNRSWTILGLLVLAGVAALSIASRAPRQAAAPAATPPPPPLDPIRLEVSDARVLPELSAGVLGHRLAVTLVNLGRAPARVSLSGYEHRFAPRVLAAGAASCDTFLLDLPGEDFAWMLDGRPAARLRVAGSHLAEGHR